LQVFVGPPTPFDQFAVSVDLAYAAAISGGELWLWALQD